MCFKIEGKILLAKFIQNFDFSLDPNENFKVAMHTAITPASGTKCVLKIREPI